MTIQKSSDLNTCCIHTYFYSYLCRLTAGEIYESICLFGATEQLPISHLFIQSTALFALSNTHVHAFYQWRI